MPAMPVIEIQSLADPRVAPFAALTEAQLRNRLDPAAGLFIAESPKVIRVALDAGLQPVAFLCERRHIDGDARDLIARCPGVPVYTGGRTLLADLTGYTLTRGVLCAFRRPKPRDIPGMLRDARRVAVLEDIVDTTNIGAIFRGAAALGMDAVLITRSCCDPLNRRAVRVSMGTVLLVPWARLETDDWQALLRASGFKTAAMALVEDTLPVDDPRLKAEEKLAVVLGTEGDGLAKRTIAECDYTVKIPMAHGVDSLNVAAASAVAFWELGKK